jgi:phage baseplate assembly protein V
MYLPSTNWLEQIKNAVREMMEQKTFVMEGIVTSINPSSPYMVKVMLEPHQIETGWLKVGSPYVGNDFGFIFPPPEEGTPVKVLFDMGNLNHGVVVCSVQNDTVTMPDVPFGTAGIIHKSGSKILLNQDGSIEIVAVGGKTVTITGQTSQSW